MIPSNIFFEFFPSSGCIQVSEVTKKRTFRIFQNTNVSYLIEIIVSDILNHTVLTDKLT
jgi:hypothetical protein